jgi:hypothetical protein
VRKEGGGEEVRERFLSRWFYQDCAWWQSSLSCWLVEAGRIFFGTTSKLIRELAYRLGKRLDDRKVYHLFPRYMFNDTESGPSFTFKTRHLGDSETIVSRIPRLWSVKAGWLGAQQRGTEQTGRCCAFRPPRGSKCSSHRVLRPSALAYPTPSMLFDNDRGVWQPQLIRPA